MNHPIRTIVPRRIGTLGQAEASASVAVGVTLFSLLLWGLAIYGVVKLIQSRRR